MLSKIIGALITGFAYLVYILPLPIRDFLGRCIGVFWFDILRIRRSTAISNLMRAYPEMTRKEATKVGRQSLIHMGYNIMEIFSFPFLDKKQVMSRYHSPDVSIISQAFKKGRGVMMLSAHVGNGDMGSAVLSYSGFPVHLVSKEFSSGWLNDFWFKARQKHGTKFIPPKRSAYEILKALKKNEMVIYVLDQYTAPPNGIVTEFFGIKTGTAFGPALLAQRSGAVVIPACSYRNKFGDDGLLIGKPIAFEEKETKEETLRHNTQNYCDAIEKLIRAHPEQWMWIHRRWKPPWTTDESGQYVLLEN